jgi:DEAD/DEAH box helicase domain-containing protein
MVERAGFCPLLDGGRGHRLYYLKSLARDRTIEPWSALLDAGREDGRLVREAHEGTGPSHAARLVEPPAELHPDVLAALQRMGIEQLYSHQAQALHSAWAGPTMITTGTASGKSLCFNLPTLDVLCRDARARALYLYPTKALAQDQARALAAFGLTKRVRPAIYDGDTPREARAQIRKGANVVLTNPDMLHVGILPNHAAWAELFANLAVVVIDEAHVYRGVFGSHVANVLRRLRRIAAAYGTEPRFLLTSATIANPVELAERLTGLQDVGLIDEDGSPTPRRRIAMWNPPTTDFDPVLRPVCPGAPDAALGTRRSALSEAAELLACLAREGARTICFIKSRKGVEVLSRLVKQDLQDSEPDLAELVVPYRAGYTPQQRRELEGKLGRGELRTVITTDALELGIDIGELDAALVVTFPGTVASLRQMWGRAGRSSIGRRGRGLAMFLAGEDALDQFFCRHPDEFLDRPVEAAILDHESPLIYRAHLLCAAHEGPLSRTDGEFLGPRWEAHAEALQSAGVLRRRVGTVTASFVPRKPGSYPAAEVSLRSASPDSFAIVDVSSGELLGSTEAARAHSTVHQGAIYMHLGRSYEVRELDLERRRALVAPFDGDWYTQPKTDTDTDIVRLLDRRETLGVRLSFGEVSVTDTVLAYQRRRLSDHAQVDIVALELPPTSFPTQALWFELPTGSSSAGGPPERTGAAPRSVGSVPLTDTLPLEILLGALHATEHAQIAVLPLIAMCDRWDIGGLSTNFHPQTGCPTIFIYDGHPGGIGIARTAFARFEELCEDASRLIAECPCANGCPSCVQSPKCGNLNEPLHKAGALALLERLLSATTAPSRRDPPRASTGAGSRPPLAAA